MKRTRAIIIWLCVVVVGLPIALFVFGDISILTDNATAVAGALLVLSLSIAGWRLKRRLKERMERGFGRRSTTLN